MSIIQQSVGLVTETTGNVVGDVLMTVLKVITGVTSGSEQVISSLGDVVHTLGKDVKVVTHHMAKGAGDLAVTVANKLGNVVEKVPLAGKPSAFVIKKAGSGIYYIVLTVSDLVGAVSKTAGKGVKAGATVIVFTIHKGGELSETVLNESNRLVQNALGKVNILAGVKSSKHISRRHHMAPSSRRTMKK